MSASLGSTFGASASLELNAGAGNGQSSQVDASDTAISDIVGVNGATYSSLSGVTYDASDAPEPGTIGLMLAGLFAGICAGRKYRWRP